jgi:hypothetical protein
VPLRTTSPLQLSVGSGVPGEVGRSRAWSELRFDAEGEALHDALLKQIEFYFSRANLSGDAYLVGQMDQQMFVPISTICNFKMMKALTEDAELIKSVMKETKSVVLNPEGSHVRPNFTNQRNTIILREIPSNTPVEDVKNLFARSAGLVQPHTVRSDIGDHWFVQFDKEADCSAAFTFLRSQTFLDKPIQARIKSENLLRGIISSPADMGCVPPMRPSPLPVWVASRQSCAALIAVGRILRCGVDASHRFNACRGFRYNPVVAVPSGGYYGMGYINRPGRVRKPPRVNAYVHTFIDTLAATETHSFV